MKDQLWTITDIGNYLQLRGGALKREVHRFNFPAPVRGSQRYRRWNKKAVKQFYTTPVEPVVSTGLLPPDMCTFRD